MIKWLSLTEYSSKYKVSISTLRRRIRAKSARFRFEDGKYLLFDSPLNKHQIEVEESIRPQGSIAPPLETVEPRSLDSVSAPSANSSSPFLTSVNNMLAELKKAYSIILQEKEEQVIILKNEVADLRTLVSVLEEENARLQGRIQDNQSLDAWLSELK